jgi:HPt (histidine-containing phosphotransfer) domain-containing protein
MKGDRGRCLSSGMDGYISKPIQPQQLYEEIDRVMRMKDECREEVSSESKLRAHETKPVEPVPSMVSQTLQTDTGAFPIFDMSLALEQFDGDHELLSEIAGVFIEDYQSMLSRIRTAIEDGDHKSLERAAHALKGVVVNFCCTCAAEHSQELEAMGNTSEMSAAELTFTRLEAEIGQLVAALRPIAHGVHAGVS